jgi:ADP-ribose pyrophosphatase YjhB (NUDIX family)
MNLKRAARTVIIDEENKTAIIDVRKGEYFKIPGGGIESGETDEEAAKREALEESGCEVELIEKIGECQFIDSNPDHNNRMIHFSVCYLAKKISQTNTNFDNWEKSNNFKLKWVTFNEAELLFSGSKTSDPFGIEINKRDLDFIKMAKARLRL